MIISITMIIITSIIVIIPLTRLVFACRFNHVKNFLA